MISLDPIANKALRLLTTAHHRWSPENLLSELASQFDTDRRSVRKVVKRLVQTGEVQYTYEFGCSFLVPSVNRPVAVSPRVVLIPSGVAPETTGGCVAVRLSHGAAFGTGSHPTTRLAVRAIDHVLSGLPEDLSTERLQALDVGTGSGVLLLAALKLGVSEGIGIDTDPCAVSEARENADLNGLADCTAFNDTAVVQLEGKFHLVMANLRLPSLLRMAEVLTSLSTKNARLVVSGIREDEADVLAIKYARTGWEMIWQETDNGWRGQAFQRLAK